MKNKYHILRIYLGILLSIVSFLPGFSLSPTPLKDIPRVNFPPPTLVNVTICNNQLPYHWNGNTYLTAGTYSVTLTGSSGTDSTVMLNLSVINVGTSITNAVICDNQLPYHWNGNTYLTNGTYSVTITSSSGCDSVPILSLTVNHVVTSSTDKTICSNQIPFNWNGNNYSATGTYSVTLTSAAGCDSIATLHLTINPVSASNTDITLCINQLPYDWNGNSYPAAGNYSITLTNSYGCDSVATLNLVTNPITSSNTAVTVCSDQLPYIWNGQAYITAGSHSVSLTGSLGCDSIATIVMTIVPVVISTTDITICTGQLPYSWNGNSYPVSGNYQVTLTGSSGCDSIAKLHLTDFTFLTGSTTASICNSDLPYNWNGNSYVATGSYTSAFVTAAGCDSIATLHLTVNTPHASKDSLVICSNELPYNYGNLVISAAGDYPLVPPIIIDDCNSYDSVNVVIQLILPSTTNIVVCNNQLPFMWNGNAYSATGSYGVILSGSAGCDSLANLNLTVNSISTSITDTSLCSDQVPYIWNGNAYNNSGVYTATLVNATGCDSTATLNLTVNPITTTITDLTICNGQIPYNWNGNNYSSTGVYTVTLTSSGGCDSVLTLNLTVQNFLTSTTNVSICNNLLPYTWNGNSYPTAGIYTVTLVNAAGCDSVATLNLIVNPVITSTTIVNTCTNLLPYTWNGNSYPAAGTYAVNLITSGGCDSIATLNLIVNNPVSSTTDIIICNNELPYSWNGNSYPLAGTFPVTLTSSSGCDSVAILHLTVTDILTSTTNVNICTNQLPYSWNGNSYSAGGTYSVTLHNANGCDSVPILSLTISPYVESTTDTRICNNALPYTWNGNNYNAAGTYSVLLTGVNCDSLATLNLSVDPPITSTTDTSICHEQFPYTWNGNNYPAPGTYSVTLPAANGCDSVATLHLSQIPVIPSTTNFTICANQLPYLWNGNSYTGSGTYSVTLNSSSGCDSIAVLHLVSNPIDTTVTNISICTNQLPYSWNGNNYLTGGIYPVTLTGSNGCDSVAKLMLVVNPIVTSTTDTSICENHLPYSWNGQNYSTAGTHVVTLTSEAGCDSIATLNLVINPVITTITDTSTCFNQLPFLWNGQSYSTAGTHVVTLTSEAGCDSIATLNLVINPVVISSTTASTCFNQLPFQWNGQNYTTPGAHTVTLTSSAGCDSLATLQLIIHPIVSSNTNYSICSAALPYSWNGFNYSASGIYTVTLTSSAGCDSVATLNLTVNPTPPLPGVSSPVTYCQYETTDTLIATTTIAGGHLVWYTSATGGPGSITTPLPSSANAGSTTYFVSQVDGPCEGPRAPITVTINSKPDLGPDKPLKICFGQSADLAALYNTNSLSTNWTINQQIVTVPTIVTGGGIYQLIVQNNFGCADTALVTLSIQPPVIANAGNDADIEYNIPYQLSGSGGGQYQWSPANLLNNPYIANPFTTLTNDTTFVLMVTDDIGCFSLDTVKLRVLNGPTFYVPSAFTPNGDGLNDIFRPTAIGISSLDFFRVYNRYGELVFETNEIGKGWDGVYKGVKQPTGNFVWTIRGTDRRGIVKVMKGNVVLIR